MKLVCQFNFLSSKYLAQLESLDKNIFPNPWPKKSWEKIHEMDYIYGLLINKGQVISFSIYQVCYDGEFAHLLKFITSPGEQNKGCGSCLIKEDLLFMESLGVEKIILEVEAENNVAISFYKKQGFTITRWKKDFYKSGVGAFEMCRGASVVNFSN